MRKFFVLLSFVSSFFIFGQNIVMTDSGRTLSVGPGTPIPFAAGSLTTLFGADNSFAGNTFDLLASSAITVTGFDVNILSSETTETVSIYYRLGTAVGFENNAGAWTLLGTDNAVVVAGLDQPSHVDVGGLALTPGQTYGIYVDLESYPTSADGVIAYTNGGPTVYSNTELSLTTNTGQASPAFSGSFTPRAWNGTVYYEDSITVPTLSTLGLIGMCVLLAGAVIVIRRRHAA